MENNPKQSEFDRYAVGYTDLVRRGIRVSGEEPSYFAAQKANYMARRLKSHGKALDILDFGCGIGNSIPHLRNAFPHARLHGVDPSTESILIASKTHRNVQFHTNYSGKLPFSAEHFDLIQVACVFHHIQPAQRAAWMEELRRVLRPDGHIFVFEHNVLNPLTVRAVRKSPVDQDAILLPRRELLNLLLRAGFSRNDSQYITFFPKALAWLRPTEPLLGWIPFGAQYVVHSVA